MAKKLAVVQKEGDEVPFEVMAQAVERIGYSIVNLSKSRITSKMIVALIHDDTKIAKGVIEKVLESYSDLERNYLKAKDGSKKV